jgi:hypothetical protein
MKKKLAFLSCARQPASHGLQAVLSVSDSVRAAGFAESPGVGQEGRQGVAKKAYRWFHSPSLVMSLDVLMELNMPLLCALQRRFFALPRVVSRGFARNPQSHNRRA